LIEVKLPESDDPGKLYVKNEVYAHLADLSPLQQRILVLLGFSTTIYTQLGGQSFTPE
jgi:hypothetical protein